MALKKGKGHSNKARHHIGIPEGGVGISKEQRKRGRAPLAKEVLPKCCGQEMKRILFVWSGGKRKTKLWCYTCNAALREAPKAALSVVKR